MANVLFKRGNTATINSTAITDGQLLYDTTTGQHYIDNESTRVEVGKPEKPVVNTMDDVIAITDDNIPCGTKPIKELNKNFGTLSDNGNITSFEIGTDGKPYINYKVGADTVTKKLGSMDFSLGASTSNEGGTSFSIDVTEFERLMCTCTIDGYAYTSLNLTGTKKSGNTVALCTLSQPYPATGKKTQNIDVDITEYKSIALFMNCYKNSDFWAVASISNFKIM